MPREQQSPADATPGFSRIGTPMRPLLDHDDFFAHVAAADPGVEEGGVKRYWCETAVYCEHLPVFMKVVLLKSALRSRVAPSWSKSSQVAALVAAAATMPRRTKPFDEYAAPWTECSL